MAFFLAVLAALIFFLYTAITIYFIPSSVANKRKHNNKGAILALNIFLGWTIIGWIVALVWALYEVESKRTPVTTKTIPYPVPDNEGTGNVPTYLKQTHLPYKSTEGENSVLVDIYREKESKRTPVTTKTMPDNEGLGNVPTYLKQAHLPYKSTEDNDFTLVDVHREKENTTYSPMPHEIANTSVTCSTQNKNTPFDKSSEDKDFVLVDVHREKEDTTYSSTKIPKPSSEKNEHLSVFYSMRKVGRKSEVWYRSNTDVFVKQGKFMEDFCDEYTESTYFHDYYPTYNCMDDNQLHTYFTWRTKVRNKEVTETSLSYVFVYIYELINNIGVKNPNKGIESLIELLKGYSKFDNQLKRYLVDWIKDYYICNQFDISFSSIVKRYELEAYYPPITISKDTEESPFDTLCYISRYKIKNSKFFTKENEAYIIHCLNKVVLNLKSFFSQYDEDFNKLVVRSIMRLYWWEPFNRAIYKKVTIVDKEVILSETESYSLERDEWKAKSFVYPDYAPLILGYIVKRVEAILRELTEYRNRLTLNHATFKKSVENCNAPINIKKIIALVSFDNIIKETTITEFFTLINQSQTEVKMDMSKLDKIREGITYSTQNKNTSSELLNRSQNEFKIDRNKLPKIREDSNITQEKLTIENDVIEAETVQSPPILIKEEKPIEKKNFNNPIEAFCDSLTEIQRQALMILLGGMSNTAALITFAEKNKIMLEVLLESINELALDIIGDNIIETTDDAFCIYDDYFEELKLELERVKE